MALRATSASRNITPKAPQVETAGWTAGVSANEAGEGRGEFTSRHGWLRCRYWEFSGLRN